MEGNLERLLSRAEAVTLIRDVMTATGMPSTVWHKDGSLVLELTGSPVDQRLQRHAILCEDHVVGWVSGGEQAELMAALLGHLVNQEADKEALLEEVLDLYRQVNLLFNLSEKLAASLELETVARTILREASRLIEATGGAVMLFDQEHPQQSLFTVGQGIPLQLYPGPDCGVIGAVLAGTRAEIINDVTQDPRYVEGRDSIHSLICAPLTSKHENIGAVLLVSQVPVTYTAADLKLLNTLASQAAPSIENALLYERTLREARAREERLRRQVQELRIELDEARQQEKVAEITGSDYYQRLRDRADTLRRIIGGSGAL